MSATPVHCLRCPHSLAYTSADMVMWQDHPPTRPPRLPDSRDLLLAKSVQIVAYRG
jgi:hypothetical protein